MFARAGRCRRARSQTSAQERQAHAGAPRPDSGSGIRKLKISANPYELHTSTRWKDPLPFHSLLLLRIILLHLLHSQPIPLSPDNSPVIPFIHSPSSSPADHPLSRPYTLHNFIRGWAGDRALRHRPGSAVKNAGSCLCRLATALSGIG